VRRRAGPYRYRLGGHLRRPVCRLTRHRRVTRHRHPSVDPGPEALQGNSCAARRPAGQPLDRHHRRRAWYASPPTGGPFTSYRPRSGRPPQPGQRTTVHALHEGRDGKLWVGTWGGGLNRPRPGHRAVQPLPPPARAIRRSLSDDQVVSVLEDHAGLLWVGTYMGGLNRFDPDAGPLPRTCTKTACPTTACTPSRKTGGTTSGCHQLRAVAARSGAADLPQLRRAGRLAGQ
jgi:hypothetical protein